jgi:hypothetical protein
MDEIKRNQINYGIKELNPERLKVCFRGNRESGDPPKAISVKTEAVHYF